MVITTATAIIFSPTGSTKKILNSIIKGMGLATNTIIDLTSPNVRNGTFSSIEGDLVLIGVPVYAYGIPSVVKPFLKRLMGQNKPVVLIVVYGNMSKGVALNQLRLLSEASGFRVVGACSFIGEHSFSTQESPLAAGRPNIMDLEKAAEFGKLIIDKLNKSNNLDAATVNIPERNKFLLLLKSEFPYNTAKVYSQTPTFNPKKCSSCGLCARLCPVGAIDSSTMKINSSQCIRCCSCVKRCPQQARKMVFRMNLPVPHLLSQKGKKPQEPHIYL